MCIRDRPQSPVPGAFPPQPGHLREMWKAHEGLSLRCERSHLRACACALLGLLHCSFECATRVVPAFGHWDPFCL
eukprot:4027915-Alexandrium_andersonii.AAC.1